MNNFILIKIFAVAVSYLIISLPATHAFVMSSIPEIVIEEDEPAGPNTLGLLFAGLFLPDFAKDVLASESYVEKITEYQEGRTGCINKNGICENGVNPQGPCDGDYCESPDNCCYDCGCNEGYCDGVGDPDLWACRDFPSAGTVSIENLSPNSFEEYDPTAVVHFDYVIADYPARLDADVSGETCNILNCAKIDPVTGESMDCVATCDVLCGSGSLESGQYRKPCEIRFSLEGGNPDMAFSYVLYPELAMTMDFLTPSTPTLQITKSLPQIGFSDTYCGDGNADGDENSVTCCYDAGCQEGYYCDIQDPDAIIKTGVCRPSGQIRLDVDISENVFSDPTRSHSVMIDVDILNKPESFMVNVAECEVTDLEGNVEYCDWAQISLFCDEVGESSTIMCEFIIPPMTSESSYYGLDGIYIEDAELILWVSYYEGPDLIRDEMHASLGDFRVDLDLVCGDIDCELQETYKDGEYYCPLDCSCPDGYDLIPNGNGGIGSCVPENYAGLEITRIYPSNPRCSVNLDRMDLEDVPDVVSSNYDGTSCYLEPIYAIVMIVGFPDDLEVVDAYFTLHGESYPTYCLATEVPNEFVCPVTATHMPSNNVESGLDMSLTINIEYEGEITPLTGFISASPFATMAASLSGSSTVSGEPDIFQIAATFYCMHESERIDSKIDDLETKTKAIGILVGVMLSAVIVSCIICKLSGNGLACSLCVVGGIIVACISAALLFAMGEMQDKMGELEGEKSDACAATSIGGLGSSNSGSSGAAAKVGAAISAVVCALGVIGAIASAAAPAAGATAGASSTGSMAVGSAGPALAESGTLGAPVGMAPAV